MRDWKLNQPHPWGECTVVFLSCNQASHSLDPEVNLTLEGLSHQQVKRNLARELTIEGRSNISFVWKTGISIARENAKHLPRDCRSNSKRNLTQEESIRPHHWGYLARYAINQPHTRGISQQPQLICDTSQLTIASCKEGFQNMTPLHPCARGINSKLWLFEAKAINNSHT